MLRRFCPPRGALRSHSAAVIIVVLATPEEHTPYIAAAPVKRTDHPVSPLKRPAGSTRARRHFWVGASMQPAHSLLMKRGTAICLWPSTPSQNGLRQSLSFLCTAGGRRISCIGMSSPGGVSLGTFAQITALNLLVVSTGSAQSSASPITALRWAIARLTARWSAPSGP